MDAFPRVALFALAILAAPVALSQSGAQAPRPAHEGAWAIHPHAAIGAMMADIAHEMNHMQDEMRAGPMIPEARKHMAAEMRQLSEMMQRLSGWADCPEMAEAQMSGEFGELRRRIDEMAKSHSMGRMASLK